jgi:hypothetical protein
MAEFGKTAVQEWVKRRVAAVHDHYTAYDCLTENGVTDIPDETTPTQLFCPFHHNVHTMAARYYPRSGGRPPYLRCFTCKKNWDGLNMFAEFRKLRFMDALVELERRFKIRVPKRPDAPQFKELADRNSGYVSEKWADVPNVLKVLETKLERHRDKCAMSDYVKFCRVLDHVAYDYDKLEKSTPEMVSVLLKVRGMMDDAMLITDDLFAFDAPDGP